MDTEIELRSWLNRTDKSFLDNLSFGIKAWHSIELTLPTKYEIIIDEFCNNLSKLNKKLADTNEAHHTEVWAKILELLSLTYSTGSVNVQVKANLVNALSNIANESLTKKQPSSGILNALLTTLHNTSMLNYYKSSGEDFAQFVGTNLQYLIAVTSDKTKKYVNANELQDMVQGVVKSFRTYIRQTPFLDTFKPFFNSKIYAVLCELFILLRSTHGYNYSAEHTAILQELYFDGNQTKEFKQFLQGPSGNSDAVTLFRDIFHVPLHVFLMTLETALISFKNDTDIMADLFKYLLANVAGTFNHVTKEPKDTLDSFTYFLSLLKKYDVSLNFEVNGVKAYVFVGQKIEVLVNECYEEHPWEVMKVACAALHLNALILEHSAVSIAVKFMLIPKTDAKIWKQYEVLMYHLIEMFRKLSRPEKLVSQLIKNVWETLSTVKLSKKLKRKFDQSFLDETSPAKRIRSNSGDAVNSDTEANTEMPATLSYFQLLKDSMVIATRTEYAHQRRSAKTPSTQNWSEIAFAFPPSVATCYTKLISGLVSKPSLVVWKTLLFTLKDYVTALADDVKNSENTVFLIELTCALLSQYFIGCRLAEQADKSWEAIENNRKQTYEVLSHFGHVILNQEHNYRTMNAFLKLCYSVSNFDLVCWYYCPDSMQPDSTDTSDDHTITKIDGLKNAQRIHSYLSLKEWIIIEQRITNFGKRECKSNINQVYMQRVKAAALFSTENSEKIPEEVTRTLLSSTFSDIEQIAEILEDKTVGPWFLTNLDAQQKRLVCGLVLDTEDQDPSILLSERVQDREYVNTVILSAFKFITRELYAGKKASPLKNLAIDNIFEEGGLEAIAIDLTVIIKKYASKEEAGVTKIKQESHNNIAKYLQLLNNSPIGFCPEPIKNVLILFSIIFYHNFQSADDKSLCNAGLLMVKKILNFDQFPALFRYISIDDFINVFLIEPEISQIVDLIFDRLTRNLDDINSNMLNELLDMLERYVEVDEAHQEILLDIANIAVVQLSKNKKTKEFFDKFRNALLTVIKNQFTQTLNRGEEDLKRFVAKTLSAFVTILKTVVARNSTDIDDQLINVSKHFLKLSVDCTNPNSVKLINVILNNRAILQFNETELASIIDQFWLNFKECCKMNSDQCKSYNLESVLKIIFDFKSTEDWICLLNELDEDIKKNVVGANAEQNSQIISYMSKCQFNKVKGQIYSEFYKQITLWMTLALRAKETSLTLSNDAAMEIVRNHTTIVKNVQIPISLDLIDDILSFMTELNIKKFDFLNTNVESAAKILREMIKLCEAMISQRHFFIVDRVAQFGNVFKDLLQAVCWYKSERGKADNLDAAEITMLAEMAHSLEKISKMLVSHAKDVKRIAPYMLVFLINLMISNDRPVTLYPRIKTHFEYICYDFISICDHRVDGFILRCSNEASKPVYENLVKDYQKYHKFKGKV